MSIKNYCRIKKALLFGMMMLVPILNCVASDEVTLHNGNVIKGKVVDNEPSYIKFTYEGDSVADRQSVIFTTFANINLINTIHQ